MFLNEADALAKKNPVQVVRDSDGSKIDPPKNTFVSAADGQVKIPGLRWSTWANNAEVQEGDKGYQAYWLVETKSPKGFTLLAEPIKVEVNSTTNAVVVSGASGNSDNQLETVVNVPDNGGFELPKDRWFWDLDAGSWQHPARCWRGRDDRPSEPEPDSPGLVPRCTGETPSSSP